MWRWAVISLVIGVPTLVRAQTATPTATSTATPTPMSINDCCRAAGPICAQGPGPCAFGTVVPHSACTSLGGGASECFTYTPTPTAGVPTPTEVEGGTLLDFPVATTAPTQTLTPTEIYGGILLDLPDQTRTVTPTPTRTRAPGTPNCCESTTTHQCALPTFGVCPVGSTLVRNAVCP